jgi:hypothetical protein
VIKLPEGISFPEEWILEEDDYWKVLRAPSRSKPGTFHTIFFYKRSRELECSCDHFRYYKDCFHLQTIRGYWAQPQKVGGLAETSLESFKLLTEDLLAKEHSTILTALLTKGPMSNRKISEETRVIISSVTARVYELREDGFVREHSRQKDPDTGKTVIVWEAVNPISLENWNRSAIIEKVVS